MLHAALASTCKASGGVHGHARDVLQYLYAWVAAAPLGHWTAHPRSWHREHINAELPFDGTWSHRALDYCLDSQCEDGVSSDDPAIGGRSDRLPSWRQCRRIVIGSGLQYSGSPSIRESLTHSSMQVGIDNAQPANYDCVCYSMVATTVWMLLPRLTTTPESGR